MKNLSFFCAALAAPLYVSCLAPVPAVKEPAVLRLSCDVAASKATSDPYDIYNYELTLSKGGKTVWHGLWGERPAEFELDPGEYQISMTSDVFEVPITGFVSSRPRDVSRTRPSFSSIRPSCKSFW